MTKYVELWHEGELLGFIERVKNPPSSYAPDRVFARPGLRGEARYVAHLSRPSAARNWGIKAGRCPESQHLHIIGGKAEALAAVAAHLGR